jgi:general secretion pathway protein L
VKLQAWLDMLAEAGIVPSSVIAESYGLARIPGTISLLLAEDSVFINDGADVELVMQGVSPGDALVAIGALDDDVAHTDDQADGSRVRPRHILVYCAAADDERYRHDWLAIRQELDSLDVKLLPDGVMPRLAVTVATGAGVNLLQGTFAPKREYSGLLRPWRHVAMLLVGLGLVGLAVKVTDYYVLSAQETELREAFNSEYQAMVPGAPTTDDPMAVVDSLRRRLGTVESSPVFLQSMEQLSNAIAQNRQARIQAISFRGGVIDLRISAPDVATLDAVQRSIAESGQFSAAIQSTDQEGDRVASRIQIEEAG